MLSTNSSHERTPFLSKSHAIAIIDITFDIKLQLLTQSQTLAVLLIILPGTLPEAL
jgi:hypothetical protein